VKKRKIDSNSLVGKLFEKVRAPIGSGNGEKGSINVHSGEQLKVLFKNIWDQSNGEYIYIYIYMGF